MRYWLLKSEPDEFGWAEQASRGDAGAIWDGVRNHQAARFLREMSAGDEAFFYHTGSERQIVGIVTIIETAFPDPGDASGRFVAVRTRARRLLGRPVTLAELKQDARFAECALLRQPRLSVMPIADDLWDAIVQLGDRNVPQEDDPA